MSTLTVPSLVAGMPATAAQPWPPPPPIDAAALVAAVERFRAADTSTALPDHAQATDVPDADADAPGRRDGLIPAPPGGGKLGPFNIYGLALGTAGVAGFAVFRKVGAASAIPGATMARIMIPSVAAALVGARLYHVATQWQDYKDTPGDIPKMWEGGMGIYGGLAAGALVGAAIARHSGIRVSPLLDAAAIALPIAQALGRTGNYANQELFGGPTDAPWGLQVDPEYRPEGMEDRNSFHPTFLYEAGWNLALAGGLYGVSKAWQNRPPGALFAMYLGGYGVGRFLVEGLRVDESNEFMGLRTNQWTSLGLVAASAGALALMVAKKGGVG